ncbi:MAG: KpsF/GutQ family sugar-phosphate isomerase [Kiritimatiellia bacterium]|nr:KpsF/GutQ family sugar-phosphate isomerase [Kiritimatiellia bacterium]MDP6848344.1 KpsF/GutQ family sugar-phosphate isomerase [Kiritimatiellia bacterium]
MNYLNRAHEVLDIEIEGLQRVRQNLGDTFTRACDLILSSLDNRGKIVVTGIGKSLHIAEKLSATLASTGSTSVVLNPSQAMHGDFGILCENDVLIALSYSGESDELVALIPIVKRVPVSIVSITGCLDSTLAQHSDVVIPVTVDREACPFNMAPTSSTTVTLAVGDALAMVLLEARGFNKEDYAKLHPGGAIGRALLVRASDIMRTGDSLAQVHEDAVIQDALVAMTKARSGSTAVLDSEGQVVGIFTDGDLRRHISDEPHFLARPVREVMTHSPITVTANQLAVAVLQVYEDHRIDDVLVVDEAGRLAGAIDIQDLPRLKIM